ncbi:DMT family transporter [Pararhizobium haloflavum]|uniref:DMT family transporter n=1 Tax=Pararhizobium haloflavum TaxID=2037914 RepID=UPI000C17A3C8|nr:DMT family transporter [Pararhizobium haloflavum]
MTIERLVPALFVLLWSTGWIVARYAAPHADPLFFLSLRYAFAGLVFLVFCVIVRANWPRTRAEWGHAALSGVLLHAIYLGGVWWAIAHGVPTALSGLIAALQPLLTALSAPFIVGERLSSGQRLGIVLGLVGLLIAIVPNIAALDPAEVGAAIVPLIVNVVAMFSVTAGTLYQKRYLQTGDLRTIATLQYLGAFVVTVPAVLLLEDMRIVWNFEVWVALLWSVFGLSALAIALLLYLIRRGQVSRAASLIYLVPPTVAVQAFLYFGEDLPLPMIVGTVVVAIGVYLTNRK